MNGRVASAEPDAPTEPDAPIEADAPLEARDLTEPDAPNEPDALAEPDAPNEPDALAEPDAPNEPDALAEPDAPNEPDALAEPDALTEPDAAGEPDAHIEPDAASVLTEPDAASEPDAPIEPEAANALTEPDAPIEPDATELLTEEVLDGAVTDDHTHDAPRGTALSLTEAALATGRHRSTLRRHIEAERFPNAHRGAGGAWRIPIADLLTAGLLVSAPRADPYGIETALERLRAENAELRRRLDVAEALANERAARIGDLRLSLRMLPTTNPPARTIEAPGSINPFVWSGEITQVEDSRS